MYVEVTCPLCGSAERRIIHAASREAGPVKPEDLACSTALLACFDRIVECRKCALYYTSPRPDNDEIAAAYAKVADVDFLEERHARELTYRRILRTMARCGVHPPGRLLDVGCSTGFFLNEARVAGWDVEGIEPSGWAADHARSRYGLQVRQGPIDSTAFEPESFDVITAWDVVEHLVDPAGDMIRLASLLKPGGVVGISTHSIASPSARLLGRRYPFLMAMHVTHFTPRTTALLFEKAGLAQFKTCAHLRSLRVGYLLKKLDPRLPGVASVLRSLARTTGFENRHVVVTGLGIFNAFARKTRNRDAIS